MIWDHYFGSAQCIHNPPPIGTFCNFNWYWLAIRQTEIMEMICLLHNHFDSFQRNNEIFWCSPLMSQFPRYLSAICETSIPQLEKFKATISTLLFAGNMATSSYISLHLTHIVTSIKLKIILCRNIVWNNPFTRTLQKVIKLKGNDFVQWVSEFIVISVVIFIYMTFPLSSIDC